MLSMIFVAEDTILRANVVYYGPNEGKWEVESHDHHKGQKDVGYFTNNEFALLIYLTTGAAEDQDGWSVERDDFVKHAYSVIEPKIKDWKTRPIP